MMTWMAKFKVGFRISAGFILVLLFLTTVAAISYFSLQSAANGVVNFARISNNSMFLQEIDTNAMDLRRAIRVYSVEGSAKALEAVQSARKAIHDGLTEYKGRTHTQVRKALADDLLRIQMEYDASIDGVVKAKTRMGETQNDGLQGEFRKTAHTIEDSIKGSSDLRLSNALLTMRRHEKDFLLRSDSKLLDAFDGSGKELKGLLVSAALPAEARSRLETALDAYMASFHEMASLHLEIQQTSAVTLPGLGRRFSQKIDELTASQLGKNSAPDHFKGSQRATEEDILALVSEARLTTLLVAIAALVLGAVCAWVIARGITVPILDMTHAMTRLSGGDNAVIIPALGNKDEIGEMAKAVEVFKQNAIDKLRMEAEQRAAEEEGRRVEEEQRAREAAIVAEVADVAQSASAGNMERRIDHNLGNLVFRGMIHKTGKDSKRLLSLRLCGFA